MKRWTVVSLFLVGCCWGQPTKLSQGTQASQVGPPNYTNQQHTKTVQMGTSLPGSCEVGDLFLNPLAGSGQNFYACIGSSNPGTWVAISSTQGGGGGSSTAATIGPSILVTDSGSTNSYAGCPTPSITLTDGVLIQLRPASPNTGSASLNLCSSGAKTIVNMDGTTLQPGELQAVSSGFPGGSLVVYHASSNYFVLLTPAQNQVSPSTKATANKYARSNGTVLVFGRPGNPGDGRRSGRAVANGSGTAPAGEGLYVRWITSAGSGSAVAPAGSQAAAFRQTTGGSGSDYAGIDSNNNFVLRTARNLYLDTTLAFGSAPVRLWITLSNSTSDTLRSINTPTTGTIGFRYVPGVDPTWTCVASTGSTTSTQASGFSFDTNQHRYEVRIDDPSAIHFYIDGAEVCSGFSSANLPVVTNVQPSIAAVGANNVIDFAYLYVESDK